MGTEILKSFGLLQTELEQAKSSLKGVDENIKRLIGRDPSEIIPRPGIKRNGPPNEENSRGRQHQHHQPQQQQQRVVPTNRGRIFNNHENDEPVSKRRNTSVFKRLSERPVQFEEEIVEQPQKQLISKVIVTPREVPSRQEALAAQSTDEKSRARNRRMFGALLGTLQKFQQEETKLKSKEQKRAQVEKKIEEHEIRERAEIKKERQELFFNRKKKQAEIKMIELKMNRMREYAVWEERQKPRSNFILTRSKPHICYLPRKLNDANKTLLENSKTDVEKMIDTRRQEVYTELQHIEERMRRNFEPRRPRGEEEARATNEGEQEGEGERETTHDSPMEDPPPEADERENSTTAAEEPPGGDFPGGRVDDLETKEGDETAALEQDQTTNEEDMSAETNEVEEEDSNVPNLAGDGDKDGESKEVD